MRTVYPIELKIMIWPHKANAYARNWGVGFTTNRIWSRAAGRALTDCSTAMEDDLNRRFPLATLSRLAHGPASPGG